MFPIQLVGEIDIVLAVEQVTKIQTGPLEVHGIDLKITPVERSVGVVMIDLAVAPRIFGTLDRKGQTAVRAEFLAGVLLPGRETAPVLVGLGRNSARGHHTLGHNDRPLELKADRRLKAYGVLKVEPPSQSGEG